MAEKQMKGAVKIIRILMTLNFGVIISLFCKIMFLVDVCMKYWGWNFGKLSNGVTERWIDDDR